MLLHSHVLYCVIVVSNNYSIRIITNLLYLIILITIIVILALFLFLKKVSQIFSFFLAIFFSHRLIMNALTALV